MTQLNFATGTGKIEGKDIAGKLRLTLVPTSTNRSIAKVREYGSVKYGSDDNWKKVPAQYYKDALYRHWLAFLDDPYSVDKESGLLHIEHLLTNASFLNELVHQGKG